MTITQVSQKQDERASGKEFSTRAPLSERIMKKVAAAALLVGLATLPANCTFNTSGLNITDAGQTDADADMDADTDVDADTDHDGGPDLDADVDTDADSDVDGGPDLDADTDVDADTDDGGPDLDADTDADLDGGMDADADSDLDGGPDADVDADVDDGGLDADVDTDADAGPVACASTFVDSISTTLVYVSTPVSVGGYIFSNNGESGSGITMDISCEADSEPIEGGVYIEDGGSIVIDRPIDGKRITIYNLGSTPTAASMTIHVETL